MEINTNTNSYIHQLSDNYTSKIKQGEALEAIPYKGTAFDNANLNPPLTSYTSHGYYGKEASYEYINESMTYLINADKESHTLQSYEYTDRNIELYAETMRGHGDAHTTKSTVSVGGVFIALETTWGQVTRPFAEAGLNAATSFQLSEFARELYNQTDDNAPNKAALEAYLYGPQGQMKTGPTDQFLAEANGDMSVFAQKLEEVFGDLVSFEQFSEGEGPTYAEGHLLLNDSTFEEFVSSQTGKMKKAQSYYDSFDEELAKQKVLGSGTYQSLQLTESDYQALGLKINKNEYVMKTYDEISKLS